MYSVVCCKPSSAHALGWPQQVSAPISYENLNKANSEHLLSRVSPNHGLM